MNTVAIIGRPNVGKSTLFNRLIGTRVSITSDVAGTTRDRIVSRVTWRGTTFVLIDTAGIAEKYSDLLGNQMEEQAKAALLAADVIILVIDGSEPLTASDQAAIKLAR